MRKLLLLSAIVVMAAMLFLPGGARAQSPANGGGVRYVLAEGGVDAGVCNNPQAPCRTIGYALSQAHPGDVIRIANQYQTAVYHERVMIPKSVRLEGGWNVTALPYALLWRRPEPCESFRTIIDGGGGDRVMDIMGGVTVEVDCLVIQNGNATIRGGFGGGIYVKQSHLVLTRSTVRRNVASDQAGGRGGGIYLHEGSIIVKNSVLDHNTASTATGSGVTGWGGGIYLWRGDATISDVSIVENRAATAGHGLGGGIYSFHANLTLTHSTLWRNFGSASKDGFGSGVLGYDGTVKLENDLIEANGKDTGWGGGVYLTKNVNADISYCRFLDNRAQQGGGLNAYRAGKVSVRQCYFRGNHAAERGGAVLAAQLAQRFDMDNTVVADNNMSSGGEGAAVYLDTATSRLRHNSFDNNWGNGGIVVASGAASIYNSIISNHQHIGVKVASSAHANLFGTLWWNNNPDTIGAVSIAAPNIHAFPDFVNVCGGDYHLEAFSQAIDAGMPSGERIDMDGELRPVGSAVDIGADEYQFFRIVLPRMMR